MNRSHRLLAAVLILPFVILVAAPVPTAVAAELGDVFVIPLENHNFTQPKPFTTSPEQLLGNPAAPFLNSLVTARNANAKQTSYASNCHNVAGLHPRAKSHRQVLIS